MSITKIIQIVGVIVAGLLFFIMKSNVKWGVLIALVIVLVAHFWEYLKAKAKVELGKIDAKHLQ